MRIYIGFCVLTFCSRDKRSAMICYLVARWQQHKCRITPATSIVLVTNWPTYAARSKLGASTGCALEWNSSGILRHTIVWFRHFEIVQMICRYIGTCRYEMKALLCLLFIYACVHISNNMYLNVVIIQTIAARRFVHKANIRWPDLIVHNS